MNEDFYAVLGVESNATQDEIKRAYRQLARKYHPDKNPGDAAAESRFKDAAEAYRVLGDRDLRAQYDRSNNGGGDIPNEPTGTGDIFGDIFGTNKKKAQDRARRQRRDRPSARGSSQRRPRETFDERGNDYRYDLTLSFEEAALGTETRIQIPGKDRCGRCHGTGAEQGTAPTLCRRCDGTGTIKKQQGFFDVSARCPDCGGSGKMIPQDCRGCRGSGFVEVDQTISVKVPPGVASGTRLKIRGEGAPGSAGGAPGDLIVLIDVEPHPIFEREEDDLVTEVPITLTQALLGAQVEIPTFDGRVRMRIPPGSASGRVFRLKGKGFPSVGGRGRGDQRVRVVVEMPTYLTEDQRELIEELAETERTDAHPKVQDFQQTLNDLYD